MAQVALVGSFVTSFPQEWWGQRCAVRNWDWPQGWVVGGAWTARCSFPVRGLHWQSRENYQQEQGGLRLLCLSHI